MENYAYAFTHLKRAASVESGKRNISIVNLEKVANALSVNLSELFKDI